MYCFEESRGEVSFQVCVKFSSVAECLGLRYMLKLKDSVFFFLFFEKHFLHGHYTCAFGVLVI